MGYRGQTVAVATLLVTDPRFSDHRTFQGHPERPERLRAVTEGVRTSGVTDDLVLVEPSPAPVADVARVHDVAYLESLERFCTGGGGALDMDTSCGPESFEIARLAAGAGLDAVDRLDRGEADSAFLAVRPPGHHATRTRAMGFCLINNVAVTAAALAARGDRVLIVDIDAHHGNGTQDVFWDEPAVTYVSIHEHPLYPGTGRIGESGGSEAPAGIVNVPVPAGTAGDVYRRFVDEIVVPVAERVAPDWLLLSTGFDAHRDDPLTGLGLTSGDYHDLTARVLGLAVPGRRIVFLEGGYDLDAVARSTAATLAAMAGTVNRPEPITTGGPGDEVIDVVRRVHQL